MKVHLEVYGRFEDGAEDFEMGHQEGDNDINEESDGGFAFIISKQSTRIFPIVIRN